MSSEIDIRKYLMSIEEKFQSNTQSDYISTSLSSDFESRADNHSTIKDIIIIGIFLDDSFLKTISNEFLSTDNIMSATLIELQIAHYFFNLHDKKFDKIAHEYLQSGVSKFLHYFTPSEHDYSYSIFLQLLYFLQNSYIVREAEVLHHLKLYLIETNAYNPWLDYLIALKSKLSSEEIATYLNNIENLETEPLSVNAVDLSNPNTSRLQERLDLLLSIADFDKTKELILKNKDLLFTIGSKSILNDFLYLSSDNETNQIIETMKSSPITIDHKNIAFNPAYFNKNFPFFNIISPHNWNFEHVAIVKRILLEKIFNNYISEYLHNKEKIDYVIGISFVFLLKKMGQHKEAHDTLRSLINAIQFEIKENFSNVLVDKMYFFNDLICNKEPESFTIISINENAYSKCLDILLVYTKIKIICDLVDQLNFSNRIKSNIDCILENIQLINKEGLLTDIPYYPVLYQLERYEEHNIPFYASMWNLIQLETSFTSLFTFSYNLKSVGNILRRILIKFLREIAYVRLRTSKPS